MATATVWLAKCHCRGSTEDRTDNTMFYHKLLIFQIVFDRLSATISGQGKKQITLIGGGTANALVTLMIILLPTIFSLLILEFISILISANSVRLAQVPRTVCKLQGSAHWTPFTKIWNLMVNKQWLWFYHLNFEEMFKFRTSLEPIGQLNTHIRQSIGLPTFRC